MYITVEIIYFYRSIQVKNNITNIINVFFKYMRQNYKENIVYENNNGFKKYNLKIKKSPKSFSFFGYMKYTRNRLSDH